MRLDAALGREPSGLLVTDGDPVVVDAEQRMPASDVERVELFVREAVRACGEERARHELALPRTHVEAAGLGEQRFAGVALELAPEIPCVP